LLESDQGASVVRKEEERGRALGISGVPFYIFNQQVAFSGAQPPAAFLEAFCRASGHTDDR
jgi:predicted DsbA family dithiol-disulfide isomerase